MKNWAQFWSKKNPIQIILVNESKQPPGLLIYVHADLLGDALFKLPAIMTLRTLFPGYRITWVAGIETSIFTGALKPLIVDYIDEVIDCTKLGMSWSEMFGPRPMNGKFYEIVVDTQTAIRKTLCLKRTKHNLFISPAAAFMFSDRKPNKNNFRKLSVQHRILQLFCLAAGKQATLIKSLNLPKCYREAALKLLPPGPCYIGLAPGAGGKNRCWPLSFYIELAKRQQEKNRTPVFFLGPGELDWQQQIISDLPQACLPEQEANKSMKPFCGPLLTLALAERIAAGVANDSGPGHILATAGQPLVSLFGPSNPEKFFVPSDKRILIRAQDYGGREMQAIPVNAVGDAVEQLLSRFYESQQQKSVYA